MSTAAPILDPTGTRRRGHVGARIDKTVVSGVFSLDGADFVSETIGIDDVESAFDNLRRGEVLRSVVVLDK